MFIRTLVHKIALLTAGPGEAVLQMLQTDREASYRLHQIEAMLNHLNANRDQQNMVSSLC